MYHLTTMPRAIKRVKSCAVKHYERERGEPSNFNQISMALHLALNI